MRKKTAFIAGVLLLLLAACAFAGAPMHEGHGSDPDMHEMGPIHEALAAVKGNDFDVVFYSMMIPHHQAAVDMAEKVRDSKDPQIQKWTAAIVKTQSEEIETMRQAVEKLGGVDATFYDMMAGDMQSMVEDTKSDRDFVSLMIPHHRAAIDMAKLAPGRTEDFALLQLCEAIVTAQTDEIAEFEEWLKK